MQETIQIEDVSNNTLSKEISCWIQGVQVKINNAEFLSDIVLSLKINDKILKSLYTQMYKNKSKKRLKLRNFFDLKSS